MIFDDIDSVEKFYKSYAHHAGFGVRVGQHKKLVDGVVMWKRFLCDRQGFKLKKGTSGTNPSQKATMSTNPSKTNSKKRKRKETRCGCDARIFVKRTSDNKYKIAASVQTKTRQLRWHKISFIFLVKFTSNCNLNFLRHVV